MNAWVLFGLLLESVLLSYSGWGSFAVIHAALIEARGLITDEQLTTFLALSQITPGPLGFYLLFVGYSVHGLAGVAMAWAALALPSLLVVPILRLVNQHSNVAVVKGAATGIIVASAALMLATASQFIPQLMASPLPVGIALVSIVALLTSRIPSFVVVLVAAALGMILAL
jgi:chromate transporter